MASQEERSRNNVRAGVFVTLTILLGFSVVVTLGNGSRWLRPWSEYRVRFSVKSGVSGLSKGSEVRVGGLPRGRVTSVEPEIVDGEVTGLMAAFEIDPDIAIYSNATAVRIGSLLGNAAWINFPDVGSAKGGRRLAEGEVIDAVEAEGMLATLMGTDNADRASNIVKNVDEVVAAARSDYDEYFRPIMSDARDTVAEAKKLAGRIQSDYDGWGAKITSFLDKANAIGDTVLEASGNARTLVDEARTMLSENRPSIDEIVENVRGASGDVKVVTERIRNEFADKVDALLDRGRTGIDAFTAAAESFREVGDRANEVLATSAPQIDEMLADARLTAQQLKLTSMEVRRSPWKLLYQPSERELEHELLYDAARSFALAAGELKISSESFERLLNDHSDAIRADPQLAERMRTMLEQSLQQYEQAQTALFSVLLQSPASR
ncbi:MAG: hypothetical protein KDA22_11820 [Phycisphaerales bacterium]|nr:hypothetical protein [Phycisphaerales bacterium]